MNIGSDEIGFDLDGVIADIGETFLRLACEEYGYCSFRLEEITSFQVESCLNMEVATVEQIFQTILQDSIATGLQPLAGAVKVISDLAAVSPVTIITARPLDKPVEDWLQHHFPAQTCSRINLVAMGDHDDKARYIRQHHLSYFVDDRLETCLKLQAFGITPILFNQPWNPEKHNLTNVASWQEIETLISFPD